MSSHARPMRGPLDSPGWLVALGRLIRRVGQVRAVVLCSVFSMTVSSLLTCILVALSDPKSVALALSVSASVSLMVSALVSWVLCSVVADLERARSLLLKLVNVDVLTQAWTRRYFLDMARRTVKGEGQATLVLIDIDDFKRINDTHGHATGDAVLHGVSKACRRQLCEGGLFARYGGEEFAVLMPEVAPLPASERMEKLRQAIARVSTIAPDGRRIKVTASFGIAALHTGDGSHERAVRKALAAADRALYRAKDMGKNRILIDPLSLPLDRPAPVGAARTNGTDRTNSADRTNGTDRTNGAVRTNSTARTDESTGHAGASDPGPVDADPAPTGAGPTPLQASVR